MPNTAVKLSADGRVENVIVVGDIAPDGYERVSFPVSMGQLLSDAKTEHAAHEVRAERDRLLAESDWTQVADAPVDQAAWAAYRQALRDVPEQAGFPESVVWPERPK